MVSDRVLVLVAHPDDEVLGCGGTLCLHRRRGDDVMVVIAAGRSAEESGYGQAQLAYTADALKKLGVDSWKGLGLPDQRLDTMPILALTQLLEHAVQDYEPTIVYVHHHSDANFDHTALFRAAIVATRPTNLSIHTVLAFETASSTEWGYPRNFAPDTWVDISEVLGAKLGAMECYTPELRHFPHPRSLRSLRARAEALGSGCCMEAAEAFMTIRRVVRF